MCGILGLIGGDVEKKRNRFEHALSLLVARGPDEKGIIQDEKFIFGCQRLKILDLITGRQPISNENSDILIVCNGEIYNFLELRSYLIKNGHKFSTKTDSEVILHLYEEEGPECLNHIEGMYAFGIYDKKNRICFLARDRFGIKPLYYWVDKDEIIFCSEIRPILKLLNFKPEISFTALNFYFWLDYIPSPYTIYKDINSLLPSHYLVFSQGNFEIKRYYRVKLHNFGNKRREYLADILRNKIEDSVKKHLISDVEIGLFLSGGIDSSILIYEMNKYFKKFKTFSIGYREKTYDESNYAEFIANKFKTEHKSTIFSPKELLNSLFQVTELMEQPFADHSLFPTYFLSKTASVYLKAVISGDGGDEIFGGYQTYIAHKIFYIYKNFPKRLFKSILENLLLFLPKSDRYFSLDFCLARFLRSQSRNDLERHLRWMESFGQERRKLLSDLSYEDVEGIFLEFIKSNFIAQNETITGMQLLDIYTYLANDILYKADFAGMNNSLEVRVPYLNRDIVEFGLSLPENLKIRGLKDTKSILRFSYRDVIPALTLRRKKMGFSLPISNLLRNELKNVFLNLLDKRIIPSYISLDYVRQIFKEHMAKKVNHRKLLWNFLIFILWHESNKCR